MFTFYAQTDGKSSSTVNLRSQVRIKTCELVETNLGDQNILKLRLDSSTWIMQSDGLIHNDIRFLENVKSFFSQTGLDDCHNIQYASFEKQSKLMVCLVVSDQFARSYRVKIQNL